MLVVGKEFIEFFVIVRILIGFFILSCCYVLFVFVLKVILWFSNNICINVV